MVECLDLKASQLQAHPIDVQGHMCGQRPRVVQQWFPFEYAYPWLRNSEPGINMSKAMYEAIFGRVWPISTHDVFVGAVTVTRSPALYTYYWVPNFINRVRICAKSTHCTMRNRLHKYTVSKAHHQIIYIAVRESGRVSILLTNPRHPSTRRRAVSTDDDTRVTNVAKGTNKTVRNT